MDRNIAALLREDARTVHVSFEIDPALGYPDLEGDDCLQEPAPTSCPKSPARTPSIAWRAKTYTYVTHFDVKPGDYLVVQAQSEIKLAQVRRVDDEVKIEPNSTTEYRWAISKINMEAHSANMARNEKIKTLVADAYRANMRRSFAQQILGAVADDKRETIAALLGPSSLG